MSGVTRIVNSMATADGLEHASTNCYSIIPVAKIIRQWFVRHCHRFRTTSCLWTIHPENITAVDTEGRFVIEIDKPLIPMACEGKDFLFTTNGL